MALPNQTQPNLAFNFSNQYSISHSLFNIMLDTAKTGAKLKRAWVVISHDIDLGDAQERERKIRQNRDN